MRVLIAVHGYPSRHNGGAERRAQRTAQQLTQRGHAVFVLCIERFDAETNTPYWTDSVEDGVSVRRVVLNTISGRPGFRQSYYNDALGEIAADLISTRDINLLHLFSGYLMGAPVIEAAKELGIPVVVSLTDYWWMCHRITLVRTNGDRCTSISPLNCARCRAETSRRFQIPAEVAPRVADAVWGGAQRFDRLANMLGRGEQIDRDTQLRSALAKADAYIAPSKYLADRYIAYGLDPAKIQVWQQGVDLDRCVLRTPGQGIRFGYLGQVKRHKGVDLLVDAWRNLRGDRDRSLVIYGSDAGETEYGESIRTALSRIDNARWPGEFRGEPWHILSQLDVLVVPSRWVENSPNAILEAQAVGVPVVTANLGGMAELIDHEVNGLLFDVESAASLTAQLQRLIDDPSLLPTLRQPLLPFKTIDDEIDEICGLYDLVTSSNPV